MRKHFGSLVYDKEEWRVSHGWTEAPTRDVRSIPAMREKGKERANLSTRKRA